MIAAANHVVDIAQRMARGEVVSRTIDFLIWRTGASFPAIIPEYRQPASRSETPSSILKKAKMPACGPLD